MEDKTIIDETIKILRLGGIILYPTDTIWGLGCDATNEEAVAKLMALKKRNDSRGFIILVDLPARIPSYVVDIPEMAWDLIELSDKPLTIVFDKGKNLAPSVYGEKGTIAIRVTRSKFCQQLISRFGRPIVSTSANYSGNPFPKNFNEISQELISSVNFVVPETFDSESTGKPSSIIALGKGNQVRIFRE
ncbi:L-threonylcarbamoyladenylate synthase [Tenuifilum osseticum]|uniref:L-threonylcarbamoyladenylate synthase n=1 Tax=Tenuifilum osseticum TaxID=3374723 RepID=UPI0034E5408F